MKMRLSNYEKNVEEILRNISGYPVEEIDNVLKSIMTYALLQYSEGENFTIPYFGTYHIEYVDDVITKDGREANLKMEVFPSKQLKSNIGHLEDVRKSGNDDDILKIPIVEDLMRSSENALRCILNDSELEDKLDEE